jgi:hypothetical protein
MRPNMCANRACLACAIMDAEVAHYLQAEERAYAADCADPAYVQGRTPRLDALLARYYGAWHAFKTWHGACGAVLGAWFALPNVAGNGFATTPDG